ncbi:MAG: glycerol-3-phosphate 1-O-acyltransferase PlsY [Deltaproteobacteria bacterium]|nr:glycerol-3-phosphate 1-O-acyltransferase PlsY [Deltaproteobacteria bacterium]
MNFLLVFLCSYIIGSIPFGFIIAKKRGVDIRNLGSGNIGATNIFRSVGKKEGLVVLILDMLKGACAVFLTSIFIPQALFISLVATVLGHDFSILLKFKGGKGVATTYGASLVAVPLAAVIGLLLWIAIFLLSRFSSLSALISYTATSILVWFFYPATIIINYTIVFLWALMCFKHIPNIKRLAIKEEKRLQP